MKPTILNSLFLVALIPLIALAIEPTNPQGFCDRFISEKDLQLCLEKIKKEDVDWYAATVCNLQKEDPAFWTCWESIKNQAFNPALLEQCGEGKDLNDLERQHCLDGAKSTRAPADDSHKKTNSLFQPLKITK
jgi:hypothetical protein